MSVKALARYTYARVPGVAKVRFTVRDFLIRYRTTKREFGGLSLLDLDGLIVDIGAYHGETVRIFRRLKPSCHVLAFEPDPRSAQHLANTFRKDNNIDISRCALGSEEGIVKFYSPQYGYWDCDGMPAASYSEATEWLRDTGRMYRFDQTKLSVKERTVKCERLDSYELSPVLIKLHTQNSEPDIIKGAVETLKRSSPILLCAFAQPEFIRFVGELGYKPYTYRNEAFIPGRAPQHTTFTWFFR